MKRQLLVTTGATVTFVALLEKVLAGEFMDTVLRLGYDSIVVQYGASDESYQLVSRLTRHLQLSESSNGFHGQYKGMQVQLIPFDVDLVQKYVKPSAVVISHAGTGSIIDTLRGSDATLLVVVNETLQDNHQLEVASAFEYLGVLQVAPIAKLSATMEELLPRDRQLAVPMGRLIERAIFSGEYN